MEGQQEQGAGDEDSWAQEGDGSSTSDSEAGELSTGPTTGVSAGGSAVGNSTTGGDGGATSTSRPKRMNRKKSKGGRIAADITKTELAQYFDMPTEEAAKRLGIGLTVLKRVCRRHGVTRWPYRKMKSLDRLIVNVQSGVAPGQSNKHLMVSPAEILQHKEKMCAGATLDIDPETRRLQQAYSKFNHKLRKTHKYDLMTLKALAAGSSSAADGDRDGELTGTASVVAGGARANEVSSQAREATLLNGPQQEVDSSLRPLTLITGQLDEPRDAASHLTGGPPPSPSTRTQLTANNGDPSQNQPTIRIRSPGGDAAGAGTEGGRHPAEVGVPVLGAAAGTGVPEAGNVAHAGMVNILHSIPPWATLSTFLSGGAAPEYPLDLPHGPSRTWLDMLTSQEGMLSNALLSSLHTPSTPLLHKLTTTTPPPYPDPVFASPSSLPACIPNLAQQANILLHSAQPSGIPNPHAFAINGAWPLPPAAVFNASLAFLPSHAATVAAGQAMMGAPPYRTSAVPLSAGLAAMSLAMPAGTHAAEVGQAWANGAAAAFAQMQASGAEGSHGTGSPAVAPPPAPAPAPSPLQIPATLAAATGTSPPAELTTLDNIPSSSRGIARKRSVFEKVQQQLAGRGSLTASGTTAGAPSPKQDSPGERLAEEGRPPAKRPALDSVQQAAGQAGQTQDRPRAPQEPGEVASALLDRLQPVPMNNVGMGMSTSHSMLTHMMDPPVLLSVNLQSLHSLLPFFHSAELPSQSAGSQPLPVAEAHASPPTAYSPNKQQLLPTPLTDAAAVNKTIAPLFGLNPAARAVAPAAPPPISQAPTHTPAQETTDMLATTALPQAEAMAFLQARAHSMSRLAQNLRLSQLPGSLPVSDTLESLLGDSPMSDLTDAQARGVLQLVALEMGWVLESVEMVRISMPKPQIMNSRHSAFSGRPAACAAPHPIGSGQ